MDSVILFNLAGKVHDVRAEVDAAALKTVDRGALVTFVTAELDQLTAAGAEFVGVHVVRRPSKTGALELSVSISALPDDPTQPLDVDAGVMLEKIAAGLKTP